VTIVAANFAPEPRSGAGGENEPPVGRLAAADDLSRECQRFLRLVRKLAAQQPTDSDGVETAAYGLLAHLVCVGPRRTTALAEAVYSDTSTVSRQTAALVRTGLVERRPDPEDGRASLLAATPEGERVFELKRRARNVRIARLLSEWDVSEMGDLTTMLGRLNNDLADYEPERPAATDEGRPPPGNGRPT
jgi:DNA-binding MarR family transcriptional regulator